MAEGHYLIAYDVVEDRRRRKTAKVAYEHAFGGQKSALESVLEPEELRRLADSMAMCIDPQSDRVHLLRVKAKAILLGRATQLKFDEGVILI